MEPPQVHTDFAPAERASAQIVRQQSQLLLDTDLLQKFYDAVSEFVLILNPHRQIVFCNRPFASLLGVADPSELYGQRPGEALHCLHACQGPGGCGTSEFCSTCGAVTAILTSQQGREDIRECRVQQDGEGEALDLLVRATPLDYGGERFTIFAVTDISHEKRRRVLERVFFHDLMNTAAGLRGLAQLARGADAGKVSRLVDDIRHGTNQLVEEIASQRDLISAENRELPVRPVTVSSKAVMEEALLTHTYSEALTGCRLVMDPAAQDVPFQCDVTILSRVLGNMVKNAVEATNAGDAVTVGCRKNGQYVEFTVHNPGFIPRDVQLQLFKRSFSTKGPGRGLGTYSIKLLTERFLKGKAAFTTSPAGGTTFTVCCPMTPPQA